jgi:hypothetical protein
MARRKTRRAPEALETTSRVADPTMAAALIGRRLPAQPRKRA